MHHHLRAIGILRSLIITVMMVFAYYPTDFSDPEVTSMIDPFLSREILDRGADWSAVWVGEPPHKLRADRRNAWLCFRGEIEAGDSPERARLRVAVDSKYWLWINGELVVREGGLKRGPAPDTTYFDEIDIAEHLNAGKNQVSVMVWHFGRSGFSHADSGEVGLILEAKVDGKVSGTDATWKVYRHPSYSLSDQPLPNYRLSEPSYRFDARKDIGDWFAAGFDDRDWPSVYEFGGTGSKPWGELSKRPIPMWKDWDLQDFVGKIPARNEAGQIRTKLPYNCQFTPYLEVESDAGRLIMVEGDSARFTEAVIAQYVTKEGRQTYEFPGWMNGHEVVWTIPKEVKVVALKYRETGYNAEFTGSFASSDPFLNGLWEKSRRTLYVTMRDTYMDCPDRERAQWWGDEVIELEMAFYALAPESRHLARKGLLELAAWQRSDGVVYSPVPSRGWGKELPTQMLASVGQKGAGTYFLHTGDTETANKVYPAFKTYMKLWELDKDGLTVERDRLPSAALRLECAVAEAACQHGSPSRPPGHCPKGGSELRATQAGIQQEVLDRHSLQLCH
jgi:hypothetical protein